MRYTPQAHAASSNGTAAWRHFSQPAALPATDPKMCNCSTMQRVGTGSRIGGKTTSYMPTMSGATQLLQTAAHSYAHLQKHGSCLLYCTGGLRSGCRHATKRASSTTVHHNPKAHRMPHLPPSPIPEQGKSQKRTKQNLLKPHRTDTLHQALCGFTATTLQIHIADVSTAIALALNCDCSTDCRSDIHHRQNPSCLTMLGTGIAKNRVLNCVQCSSASKPPLLLALLLPPSCTISAR